MPGGLLSSKPARWNTFPRVPPRRFFYRRRGCDGLNHLWRTEGQHDRVTAGAGRGEIIIMSFQALYQSLIFEADLPGERQ